jgi:spore coat polysaccharide biosynthesis protein SpsF
MGTDTVAIIQARIGTAGRLPGKVLLPLAGAPVLRIVYDRVRAAKRVDRVVVAMPIGKPNDGLAWYCHHNNMNVYRGSEDDVLGRVIEAAIAHGARTVVDVTADCPLVDPGHIDQVVGGIGYGDYASNVVKREWPDGFDVQAFRLEALQRVARETDVAREHVGWNILRRPDAFKIRHICRPPQRFNKPEWGLTLDTPEDYELLRQLFVAMQLQGKGLSFSAEDVLTHLVNNPKMLMLNCMVARKAHEGGKWKT